MKYRLTDETLNLWGRTLHRIECTESFTTMHGRLIHIGDKGGWIQSENNLSQTDSCWVSEDAMVFDDAKVYDRALVYGDAEIWGDAEVYGDAEVGGRASIYGDAKVFDKAFLLGDAKVFGDALVYDRACVYNEAQVLGDAAIFGDSRVCGDSLVSGTAKVCGNVSVTGSALIIGDAIVRSNEDYQVFKNTWSSGRYFTWTRSNNMWAVGCFYGTGKELIKKAYKDSKDSGRHYKTTVMYRNFLTFIEKFTRKSKQDYKDII